MNPKKMKLPEVEKSVLASNLHLRREWVMDPPYLRREGLADQAILRREWVMDPPPWIKLPDVRVKDIYRIKLKHLAELTKIEIQIKELEGKMINEIVKSLEKK